MWGKIREAHVARAPYCKASNITFEDGNEGPPYCRETQQG